MPDDAFFLPDGDALLATDWTRGPWHPDHQHGGPAAALLTRAIEGALGLGATGASADGAAEAELVRISVELLRPLPVGARLATAAELARAGRRARGATATLTASGQLLARASALAVRRAALPLPLPPSPRQAPPPLAPEASAPYAFSFFGRARGYHEGMELRLAAGTFGQGAMTVWMRMRIPLLPDEEPTPAQRVAIAADSGNGVSVAVDLARYTFVNPELELHLHRPPDGEWIGLDAVTVAHPSGIGLAETTLHDRHGAIGRACQPLVIEPR